MEDTYPKLLLRNVERWGDGVALRKKEYGIWHNYTWRDCRQNIEAISMGLVSLGLETGEVVAILGDNNPEWLWSEIAVQAAGGVVAGLDPAASADTTKEAMTLSGARLALVQDQEQVDKLLETADEPPSLRSIVYWRGKGLRGYSDRALMSLADLCICGKEYSSGHPGDFERRIADADGHSPAILLFVPGRDGRLRTMPATHEFLISSAAAALASNAVSASDDYVSVLPAGWFFEQVLGFGTWLLTGQKLSFAETADTAPMDFREISPQIVVYPSRVWETLVQTVERNMKGGNWLKKAMYDRSLRIGRARADLVNKASRTGPLRWVMNRLADFLVLRPLRDKHGLNRTRVAYAAGGVLSDETSRFFQAMAVDIHQVFGSVRDGIVVEPPPEDLSIEQ